MNKMFYAATCIVFIAFLVAPVLACSTGTQKMTGSACSIKDLNNLYEKNTVKAKAITTLGENRNLRPVKLYIVPIEIEDYSIECRLGICFPKIFFSIPAI